MASTWPRLVCVALFRRKISYEPTNWVKTLPSPLFNFQRPSQQERAAECFSKLYSKCVDVRMQYIVHVSSTKPRRSTRDASCSLCKSHCIVGIRTSNLDDPTCWLHCWPILASWVLATKHLQTYCCTTCSIKKQKEKENRLDPPTAMPSQWQQRVELLSPGGMRYTGRQDATQRNATQPKQDTPSNLIIKNTQSLFFIFHFWQTK